MARRLFCCQLSALVATLVPRLGGAGKVEKIQRVQTGLRLEKNMLKVLKGLAEKLEMSVAELLEGVVLHAFEGKTPFSAETLETITKLKDVYDLDLTAKDAHRISESETDELY